MLWKFRYRNKFTFVESLVEAAGDDYDGVKAAAEAFCTEQNFRYIEGSVQRAVLFSVKDGVRTMHDPTGAVKTALVAPAKAKTA